MIPDALILHLQRLSTEDGPGLRTTVFFKGCPLRCAWCHNPESLSPLPQVQWLENRCLDCGTCLPACPDGCLVRTSQGVVIDRGRCTGCGACVEACPAGAMELLGTRIGLEALVAEVLKDRAYFETGGVTVSGGEPTMQAEFVAAFLRRLHEAGIRTALDTCGLCAPVALAALLPHADVILFDLKEIDASRHRALTSHDNRRILDNLLLVRDFVAARQTAARAGLPTEPATLWIRTPLIPPADGRRPMTGTATCENVTGIGRFLAEQMNGTVARWELCAFNNLCRDKYRRLGMGWDYAATPLLTAGAVEELAVCARRSGVNPAVVVATGATRGE